MPKFPKTTVVHVKDGDYDIYIGRKKGTDKHYGNPFPEWIHGRSTCIQFCRQWLEGTNWQNIEPERRKWILKNMHELKGKRIGCHCKPLPCHGDIYVEMLDELPKKRKKRKRKEE